MMVRREEKRWSEGRGNEGRERETGFPACVCIQRTARVRSVVWTVGKPASPRENIASSQRPRSLLLHSTRGSHCHQIESPPPLHGNHAPS